MARFTDKVVLITGGASGIGFACAERMGAEGATVFLLDINADGVNSACETLRQAGVRAAAMPCDVSVESQVAQALAQCVEQFGGLDMLCNMAGVLRFDHFQSLSLDAWQRLFSVNVDGVFLTCKLALPHLIESRGNIVNAASTAALAGLPYGAAYSASKGAILALSQALAVEFAAHGVRVNCVSPADIITPMTTAPEFPEAADLSLMARCTSMTGAKGPEVVAGVVAMLGSEDGQHISGENIRVDGACLA